MDNSCFDSLNWYSDQGSELSCSQKVLDQILVNEGYGKAPRFGKGVRLPLKPAVNMNGVHFGTNSSSQQSFGNVISAECNELSRSTLTVYQSAFESKEPVCIKPGSQESQEQRRSSQLDDIPEFESKDKKFWFCEFKRLYVVNRKLSKRLERSNLKLQRISEHVDQLYKIFK